MSDEKKTNWGGMLGGEESKREPEMSADVARALLTMNPAMRDQGLNTKAVLAQSRQAQQGKVAKTQVQAAAAKPADTKASDIRINEAGDKFRALLNAQEHDIDLQVQRLEEQRSAQREALRQQFAAWLNAKDPELLSPFTQQLLQKDKALLDKLGFTLAFFSEFQKAIR